MKGILVVLSFLFLNFLSFSLLLFLFAALSALNLFPFTFSRLNCIIVKKVGKIGGDENQVRSRIRHVLSCIDKKISFRVNDVQVF